MRDLKSLKHELQNIINSDEYFGKGKFIKTAQTHLRRLSQTSTKSEEEKQNRAEEEGELIKLANENSLWIDEDALGIYITEGAEQKIFFTESSNFVIKLADGIFYTSWLDYFNNLLLHNSFFPSSEYILKGFLKRDKKICVVLQQPLIVSTETTNLENVKQFLLENGFMHKRNNDYYHPYLGIIIEDLHDENVLTNNGLLFFIDTVFYIEDKFYETP
ncbi:MAG: hypothetical protein HZB42_14250 [Sphingobacteriales bacterium]|nr:hypothetical protein [Sphingobacteriales bacterium]